MLHFSVNEILFYASQHGVVLQIKDTFNTVIVDDKSTFEPNMHNYISLAVQNKQDEAALVYHSHTHSHTYTHIHIHTHTHTHTHTYTHTHTHIHIHTYTYTHIHTHTHTHTHTYTHTYFL